MNTMVIAFMVISCVILVPLIFAVVFMARWVYRDAMEKGLPAAMWVSITILVPNFIGLIIYLVYRSDKKPQMLCQNCERNIEMNISFCPHCGYQSPPVTEGVKPQRIPGTIVAVLFGTLGLFVIGVLMIGVVGYSTMSTVSSNSRAERIDTFVEYPITVSEQVVSPDNTTEANSVYYGNSIYETKSKDHYTLSFDEMEGVHAVSMQIPNVDYASYKIKYTLSYTGNQAEFFAEIFDEPLELDSFETSHGGSSHYEEGIFQVGGYNGETVMFYINAPYITNGYFEISIYQE